MKIKANEIGPKDFGSKVTFEVGEGTTTTRVLIGVSHKLVSNKYDSVQRVIKASYSTVKLSFLDGTSHTVAAEDTVELDPETAIAVQVYYPLRTGLR